MSWKEGADQRLLQIIADELEEPVMVESFIVIATVATIDGDQDIVVNAAPGQRSVTTLGLLDAGHLIESEGFVRAFFDER